MIRHDQTGYVEHFRQRVLQDALTLATAAYWERRAGVFEDAAPRQGDYHGQATPEELQDAAQRCEAAAVACRRHARLLASEAHEEPVSADVLAVLREVA